MKFAFTILFFALTFAPFSAQTLIYSSHLDSLKVSIYPELIHSETIYVRVAGGGLQGEPFIKLGKMYYRGKVFNGVYCEYYPCSDVPGKLRRSGMIEDGVPEGVFIGYYENGETAIKEMFIHGKPSSNPQCWDPTGIIIPFHKTSSIKPLLDERYWTEKSYSYGGE